MGRLAPTKNPAVTRVVKTHACDSCGRSKIDGGRISTAKYEVQTPGGSLFLCGSHLRRHWTHIIEHHYEVVNLQEEKADA